MVYLWLLGVFLSLLGLFLLLSGLLFFLSGSLLRNAGGNIDPERGARAAWYGRVIFFVGVALVFLAILLS